MKAILIKNMHPLCEIPIGTVISDSEEMEFYSAHERITAESDPHYYHEIVKNHFFIPKNDNEFMQVLHIMNYIKFIQESILQDKITDIQVIFKNFSKKLLERSQKQCLDQ